MEVHKKGELLSPRIRAEVNRLVLVGLIKGLNSHRPSLRLYGERFAKLNLLYKLYEKTKY